MGWTSASPQCTVFSLCGRNYVPRSVSLSLVPPLLDLHLCNISGTTQLSRQFAIHVLSSNPCQFSATSPVLMSVLAKKHPHPFFFSCQVVITVFLEIAASSPAPDMTAGDGDEDAEQPTLIFNLYCPKLSKSADVDLPHDKQKMMSGETNDGSSYSCYIEVITFFFFQSFRATLPSDGPQFVTILTCCAFALAR